MVCASDMSEILESLRVTVMFANSYVDFNDYDQPIKKAFDDSLSYKLTEGTRKIPRAYMRENSAELRDSLLDLGSANEETFYSVQKSSYDFTTEPDDGTLVDLVLSMDANYDQYERSVFTVFDFTGQIGGLYEVFEAIGRIFIGFLSGKIFLLSIISSLYHVHTPSEVSDEDRFNDVTKASKVGVKPVLNMLRRASHENKSLGLAVNQKQEESKRAESQISVRSS